MADNKVGSPTKRQRFPLIHKLSAAVTLLCFFVALIAGVMAQVRVVTILYRSVVVVIVVSLVSRIVISVLSTFEEMNRGKA